MKVWVDTNRPAYINDIADEIRVFFGMAEVALICADEEIRQSADMNISAHIRRDENNWIVEAKVNWNARTACTQWCAPIREENALLRKRHEKRAIKIAIFRLMRKISDAYTPWGSLTGIRPTKLWRELLRDEGEKEALRMMLEDFDVLPEKVNLLNAIHHVQKPFLVDPKNTNEISIYVGVPYCKTRCLYCSFGSRLAPNETQLDVYLKALLEDISLGAQIVHATDYNVRSIYIGGGTPTIFSADRLKMLLTHIRACYPDWTGEFTVEAGRPDTLDAQKFEVMRDAGVNRISINPQSMHDTTLQRIGRNHTVKDVEEMFQMARFYGFDNINMDVIVGLPGETTADFQDTLERIANLNPDSLTVHTLAIKRSSFLKEHLDTYEMISAEEAEEMVALGATYARQLGMQAYYMYRQKYMRGNLENVGYACPGHVCMYNIDMMEENVSVMAHGAGAITKRIFGLENRVERIPNPKDVETYIAKYSELNERKRTLFR